MNPGLNPANPTLTTAFKSALLNQGVLALLVFAVLAIAWVACRELLPAGARAGLRARQQHRDPEPAGRRIVRIGFGILWVFDAILQAQPAMPGGLPSRVIAPAADGSPGWVRDLVNWAGTGWSYHPVQDAAAAVWIQLGIGVWLLAAARGRWSRAAGLASAGWGLMVWIFGEAFGGVLNPGQSLLTGAPGAALLYAVGGALVALPARYWAAPALGRWWLRVLGAGLAAGALLQAWPGRGYWQGSLGGQPGSLTDMVRSMSATPQPAFLARLVTGFGSLVAAHGFAVNLIAVIVLAAGAAALLAGQRPALGTPVLRSAVLGTTVSGTTVLRSAVLVLTVFFLADWVLVQDLGFFGGLGTDPNSMIPLVVLLAGGYAAAMYVSAPVREELPAADITAAGYAAAGTALADPAARVRRLRLAIGTASASVVVALWAGAVMMLGAEPMAMAEVQRTADPILAMAQDGPPAPLSRPAVPFDLTGPDGRMVSLASLRGQVVLLTFVDPVPTGDGPLIAQEFRSAGQLLGSHARDVALVAIVANPAHRSLDDVRAFDRQQRLTGVAGWHLLTGSAQQLSAVRNAYAVSAGTDIAYVIDRQGQEREGLNLAQGPGTPTLQSSFAAELAQSAERVLGSG